MSLRHLACAALALQRPLSHVPFPERALPLRHASRGFQRASVYCAYQRKAHFFSTSENLLHHLERTMRGTATLPSGSLAACAEQRYASSLK
jgi:hypothetical protein